MLMGLCIKSNLYNNNSTTEGEENGALLEQKLCTLLKLKVYKFKLLF